LSTCEIHLNDAFPKLVKSRMFHLPTRSPLVGSISSAIF
jgi:hypothetical protein